MEQAGWHREVVAPLQSSVAAQGAELKQIPGPISRVNPQSRKALQAQRSLEGLCGKATGHADVISRWRPSFNRTFTDVRCPFVARHLSDYHAPYFGHREIMDHL